MADQLTIEQFGQKIKQKYPEYSDLSAIDIGNKMLSKYPEYQDMISINTPDQQKLMDMSNLKPESFVTPEETQQYHNLLLKPDKTPQEDATIQDYALKNTDLYNYTNKYKQQLDQLKQSVNKGLTVNDFANQNNIQPEEATSIGLPKNPDKVLEQLEYKDLTAKLESSRKLKEPNPEWIRGIVKNINQGTINTIGILANVEKIFNNTLGYEGKGLIQQGVDYLTDKYITDVPDLPKTIPGNVVGQLAQMPTGFILPLMTTPELKVAGAIGEAITITPKLPVFLGLENYIKSASENKNINETVGTTAQAIGEGYLMDLFGYASGRAGQSVNNATKSVLKGQVVNSLTNAGLFSGMTAGQ
jgi:hypothetical protein